MIRRSILAWALLALLSAPSAPAGEEGAPSTEEARGPKTEAVGVTRVEGTGMVRVDFLLPGSLVGIALPLQSGGGRDLLAVHRPVEAFGAGEERPVASTSPTDDEAPGGGDHIAPASVTQEPGPPTGPLVLVRLVPGSGTWEVLRRDLPDDIRSLWSVDFDGDGDEELVAERVGELLVYDHRQADPAGSAPPLPRILHRERGLTLPRPAAMDHPGGREPVRHLWAALPGELLLLGPGKGPAGQGEDQAGTAGPDGQASEEGPGWQVLERHPIPLQVRTRRYHLSLSNPALRRVPGLPLLAVGPVDHHRLRLQSFLFPAGGVSGDAKPLEAWARLPREEAVLDEAYRSLDGEPVLVVTSLPAGKLTLLGEKRLRVFPLRSDDSRSGRKPLLAVESRLNVWQSPSIRVLEVDGRHGEDLVLAYYKGLKDDHVALDTYLSNGDGGFGTSPEVTGFEVRDANRGMLEYGADLDGDGAADLVLQVEDHLKVYPGRADTRGGRALVEESPRWQVPLPRGSGGDSVHVRLGPEGARTSYDPGYLGSPRILDLDGDDRKEVVFAGRTTDKRPLVVVMALQPASGKGAASR